MQPKLTFTILIVFLLLISVSVNAQTIEQSIPLKQGFNFISFITVPTVTPSELKQNNSLLVEDIYLYSSSAGAFLSFSEGTLTSLSAGKGYIIKAKNNGTLLVSGTAVKTVENISLKTGFNLIGISVTIAPVSFTELMKKYNVIKGLYKWSSAAGSFIQVLSDMDGVPQIIDGIDPKFNSGDSYFINLNNDSSLSFSNGVISLTDSSNPVKVSTPVLTPAGGTYTASQSVTITCTTNDAVIYYTLTGEEPSSFSTVYSSPLIISSNTTLKVIASKPNLINSDTVNAIFVITSPFQPIDTTITINLGGSTTLEMVKIPAGTFQMGSPNTEQDRYLNEGPIHTVTISKDFYMGKYEVTQGQWKAIMNSNNPSQNQSGDRYPVETISWENICGSNGFLEELNASSPSNFSCFRLPTEAEWEYAARAGSQTRFYWDDDLSYALIRNYAWYYANGNILHEVGRKKPNAFGLYDMSGNVWEFCNDFYGSYESTGITDPKGPSSGSSHAIRGGSWRYNDWDSRSASRRDCSPIIKGPDLGFRLALTPGQPVQKTKVLAPTISPNGGSFESSQQITISSEEGSSIIYTLDGTTPNLSNGILYNGPFTILLSTELTLPAAVTIKAIAIMPGKIDSSIITSQFTYVMPSLNCVQMTNGAQFTGRYAHTSLSYNNKIWVIGGEGYNYTKNGEVWNSSDGLLWTQLTSKASFGNISRHTSLVFNNNMWVIGYSDNYGSVWFSSNGIKWDLAGYTPFSARDYPSSVVYNNKMWVIGGVNNNDVWSSSDGINWNCATYQAEFSPRFSHSSLVFNNKMWVIGGFSSGQPLNDVWSSSDGTNWIQVTPNANFSPRFGHTVINYDGKMWLIGGQRTSQLGGFSDMWCSSDGIYWVQVNGNYPPNGRAYHTNILFNDIIWIIGGINNSDWCNNDIWGIKK